MRLPVMLQNVTLVQNAALLVTENETSNVQLAHGRSLVTVGSPATAVPAGQTRTGEHTAAPWAALKDSPAVQAVQMADDVWPTLPLAVPAGHGTHAAAPLASA